MCVRYFGPSGVLTVAPPLSLPAEGVWLTGTPQVEVGGNTFHAGAGGHGSVICMLLVHGETGEGGAAPCRSSSDKSEWFSWCFFFCPFSYFSYKNTEIF